MLTRQRLPVFIPTGDWKVDAPNLHKWISDYWFELEKKGALTITEASVDDTPIGASGPDTGKFTTLEVTTSSTFPTSSTTPTVTAGGGAFTTVSGAVRSVKIGDRRFYTATVVITTNGTAATYVVVPMPDAAAETTASSGVDATNPVALTGYVTGSNLLIYKYDGTYPGADGKTLVMSGSYRV